MAMPAGCAAPPGYGLLERFAKPRRLLRKDGMLPIIGPWLRRIEEWVSARPARFLFILLAINGAFIVTFDRVSVLPADGPDIIDLHASNTVAVFEQIYQVWNTEQRNSAINLLWIDLFFPFAYATLLAGL